MPFRSEAIKLAISDEAPVHEVLGGLRISTALPLRLKTKFHGLLQPAHRLWAGLWCVTEPRATRVARASEQAWHINMLGRYAFTLSEPVARGELRPLRDPSTASDSEDPGLT
jgi:hypothetical protein